MGAEAEPLFLFCMAPKLFSLRHCRRYWTKNWQTHCSEVCVASTDNHFLTFFFNTKVIFTYYLACPLDYTPRGVNKQCEAARATFWAFSPAYIVVSHHVSQLTPLSYLSVRQLLWIRECVVWVKWYTLCCRSHHQQSAWPWRWFNQPPALLFLPK